MQSTPTRKKRRLKKKYRRALQVILAGLVLFIAIGVIRKCLPDRKLSPPGEEIVIGHHPIRGVRSYSKEFNDLNPVQLEAAQRYGVRPVKDRAEADSLKDVLVRIGDCDVYTVEELSHSIPYLTFQAAGVLETIGRNFRDSLYAKGRVPHRLIVTSVLRTQEDVTRLRRSNVNASENSTHCHATTFDITYARFAHSDAPKPEGLREISQDDLKRVLAEVLRDLHEKGLCYVKYERKQPCFHITARR